MSIYWAITLLIIVPALWTIGRSISGGKWLNVLFTVLASFCIIYHFMMFYREYCLQATDSFLMQTVQCYSTVILIPILYIYTARSIGLLHGTDVFQLLTPLIFVGIVHGEVNLSSGYNTGTIYGFYKIAIYYGETLLVVTRTQHFILLLQATFSIYKLILLMSRMKRKQYHYSKKYQSFLAIGIFGLSISIASMIPDNEVWYNKSYCIAILIVLFSIIGTGYVLLALGFTDKPIENRDNEPVTFSHYNRYKELGKRFEEYVLEGNIFLKEDVKMEDIAKALGTNRTYLSQMMKEYFGIPYSQYMNNLRIKEAKRLLLLRKDNDMKLQEIAWKSGFASLSTFNKVFKQHIGVAPSEWGG